MGERDLNGLRAAAIAGVSEALLAAEAAGDAESGLMELSRATFDLLGDRQAHRRPGALKEVSSSSSSRDSFSYRPTGRATFWLPSTAFRTRSIAWRYRSRSAIRAGCTTTKCR